MQNQRKPVLILAHNARFLAQSANQAGYRVWATDCFGDHDLIDIADRWQALPSTDNLRAEQFNTLLSQLSNGEACYLVCGSGIEYYFPFLINLPENIELIGNTFNTIKTIKTPLLFFDLLEKLSIHYPNSQFSRPDNIEAYLTKSASGYGGLHIQKLTKDPILSSNYFQRFIDGQSGSILFLANGKKCQLLLTNQQYLSATKQTPFRLVSIESPWLLSEQHQKILNSAINKITAETGLLGLNSLDFIISTDNDIYVLEINPRPSASAELIDDAMLLQHHINACRGLLPSTTLSITNKWVSLKYVYADHEFIIPNNMIWSMSCRDIPHPGTIIKKSEPIFTSLHHAKSAKELLALHDHTKNKIINQLTSKT